MTIDDALEVRDPRLVDAAGEIFTFLGERYFRWRVQGIDYVPSEGFDALTSGRVPIVRRRGE